MKDCGIVHLLLGTTVVTPICVDSVGTVFGDSDVRPKAVDSVGTVFGDSDVRPKAVDSVGTVFGVIAGVGVSSENLVYSAFYREMKVECTSALRHERTECIITVVLEGKF